MNIHHNPRQLAYFCLSPAAPTASAGQQLPCVICPGEPMPLHGSLWSSIPQCRCGSSTTVGPWQGFEEPRIKHNLDVRFFVLILGRAPESSSPLPHPEIAQYNRPGCGDACSFRVPRDSKGASSAACRCQPTQQHRHCLSEDPSLDPERIRMGCSFSGTKDSSRTRGKVCTEVMVVTAKVRCPGLR